MRDLRITLSSGVTLHIRSHGEPGGSDFLLIHGLASNARLWDETATVLAGAGHQTFAVDLRGHGESDLPDGDRRSRQVMPRRTSAGRGAPASPARAGTEGRVEQ